MRRSHAERSGHSVQPRLLAALLMLGLPLGGARAGAPTPHATHLAAGDHNTCLRAADGTVWCWGDNSFGARGLERASLGPLQWHAAPVPGITGALDLRFDRLLGGCARVAEGALACWGDALMGRLGDGRDALTPGTALVHGLRGVEQYATSGRGGCAVLADHTVQCWGDNAYGQVGDGTRQTRLVPVAVRGLTNAVQVVRGSGGSCARRSDGTVWCWGWEWGAIGNAHDLGARPTAWEVPGLAKVVDLYASDYVVYAVLADGTLMAVGAADHGMRGDARLAHQNTTQRRGAEPVPGVRDVVQLGAGHDHACAVLARGAVWCWGENDAGQRGDGTVGTAERRELQPGLDGPQTCLRRHPDTRLEDCRPLAAGGAVLAYGPPSAVVGLPPARQVAAGARHSCAVTRAGEVWCWGANGDGQLGDGSLTQRRVPGRVVGLTEVVEIALGSMHSCARRADGTVWCWGRNEGGTLGDHTLMHRAVPAPITF